MHIFTSNACTDWVHCFSIPQSLWLMIYHYFVLSSIRLVAALLPVLVLSSTVSELHDPMIGSLRGLATYFLFSS